MRREAARVLVAGWLGGVLGCGTVGCGAVGCERPALPGSEVTVQSEQSDGVAGLESLEGERWRTRPVLVFAGEGRDGLRQEQERALGVALDGVRERDIVVYVVTADGVTRDGERLAGDGAGLQSRYGVEADAWAVVLVGKDGGEKLRVTDGVLDVERLFGVIDAMPMRRAEVGE